MAARKDALDILRDEILDRVIAADESELIDLYVLVRRGSQPPPAAAVAAEPPDYRTLLEQDRPESTLEIVAGVMRSLGEPSTTAKIIRAAHVDHPEVSAAAIRGAVQRLVKAGRAAKLSGSGEYRIKR